MKLFLFLSFLGCSSAFTGPAVPKATAAARDTSVLSRMTSSTHMDRSFTADSGMTVDLLPSFIDNLTKDNFEESLEMIEPLLMNECRGDVCEFYLEDIRLIAEQLGKKIPDGYATLSLRP